MINQREKIKVVLMILLVLLFGGTLISEKKCIYVCGKCGGIKKSKTFSIGFEDIYRIEVYQNDIIREIPGITSYLGKCLDDNHKWILASGFEYYFYGLIKKEYFAYGYDIYILPFEKMGDEESLQQLKYYEKNIDGFKARLREYMNSPNNKNSKAFLDDLGRVPVDVYTK